MILTSEMYVPAVSWRQGEYQALSLLANHVKDSIVPFITIPEIEFDFETWQLKKTVHEHVQPFATRYRKKWGQRSAWISISKGLVGKTMDDGRHIFTHVFDELRAFEACAVPAISIGSTTDSLNEVKAIAISDGNGVAISVRLEDLMKPDPKSQIQALASVLCVKLSEIDLIIDLGAPNFEPYEVFSGAMIAVLHKLGDLGAFRNLVLIGTSIPETFKGVAKGADEIPRHDWMFYQTLAKTLPKGLRLPIFGDYTVVHPGFTPADMRKIKPAGKIIYTTPRSWYVCKGGSFRDNPEQMHEHCSAILASGLFRTPGFSNGDDYISKCASFAAGHSNQTKWKNVAINHHITQVVDDLASLSVAS